MASDQQFCLRWNNHQSTLVSVFDNLLESQTLVDCTLAADGQYLKAHKVVLSACSPYLEAILCQNLDKHPILILKDVKFTELKAMLDYMYRGEVNISQEQLSTFLKAAESLQIKGLTDSGGGGGGDLRDKRSDLRKPLTQPVPHIPQPRPVVPHGLLDQRRSLPHFPLHIADMQPQSPQVAREGSTSPTARKRRRPNRPSSDDSNFVSTPNSLSENQPDTSDSCDLPVKQNNSITSNVPNSTKAPETDSPRSTPQPMPQQNLPEQKQVSVKKEFNEAAMLTPKTELDYGNDNSMEDVNYEDDDDEEVDLSKPGPSFSANSQGFPPWQVGGDGSNDDSNNIYSPDVTAANNQNNSQGEAQPKLKIVPTEKLLEKRPEQSHNATEEHFIFYQSQEVLKSGTISILGKESDLRISSEDTDKENLTTKSPSLGNFNNTCKETELRITNGDDSKTLRLNVWNEMNDSCGNDSLGSASPGLTISEDNPEVIQEILDINDTFIKPEPEPVPEPMEQEEVAFKPIDDPRLQCTVCFRKYTYIKSYQNHNCKPLAKPTVNVQELKKCYICGTCSRSFPSKHKLKLHEKTDHAEDRRKLRKELGKEKSIVKETQSKKGYFPKKGQQCFECSVCQKKFKSMQKKLSHNKECGRVPDLKCSYCHCKFFQKRLLQKHVFKVHFEAFKAEWEAEALQSHTKASSEAEEGHSSAEAESEAENSVSGVKVEPGAEKPVDSAKDNLEADSTVDSTKIKIEREECTEIKTEEECHSVSEDKSEAEKTLCV